MSIIEIVACDLITWFVPDEIGIGHTGILSELTYVSWQFMACMAVSPLTSQLHGVIDVHVDRQSMGKYETHFLSTWRT